MQKAYARLPYWGEPGDGIVIIDRYNLRPKRFLYHGEEILGRLRERYGRTRSVKMYYGNESLEETVRTFRGCRVLIAAHGGGQSNMLFMPPGGAVIEVRPDNWPMPCFIDLADNVGVQHHLVVTAPDRTTGAKKCRPDKHPELCVDMDWFMPHVYRIIDDLDRRRKE